MFCSNEKIFEQKLTSLPMRKETWNRSRARLVGPNERYLNATAVGDFYMTGIARGSEESMTYQKHTQNENSRLF